MNTAHLRDEGSWSVELRGDSLPQLRQLSRHSLLGLLQRVKQVSGLSGCPFVGLVLQDPFERAKGQRNGCRQRNSRRQPLPQRRQVERFPADQASRKIALCQSPLVRGFGAGDRDVRCGFASVPRATILRSQENQSPGCLPVLLPLNPPWTHHFGRSIPMLLADPQAVTMGS